MSDYEHMCLSVPPRYSISITVDYIKGKSAIKIYREVMEQKCQFAGLHFWALGYCVSNIVLNEAAIREYLKSQEKLETHKQPQLTLPAVE